MIATTDWIALLGPLGAGILLGFFFYGGLWLTITYAVSTRNPALWFPISLLVRTGIVLAGFYLAGAGQFAYLVACLAGFLLARLILTRIRRTSGEQAPLPKGDQYD